MAVSKSWVVLKLVLQDIGCRLRGVTGPALRARCTLHGRGGLSSKVSTGPLSERPLLALPVQELSQGLGALCPPLTLNSSEAATGVWSAAPQKELRAQHTWLERAAGGRHCLE